MSGKGDTRPNNRGAEAPLAHSPKSASWFAASDPTLDTTDVMEWNPLLPTILVIGSNSTALATSGIRPSSDILRLLSDFGKVPIGDIMPCPGSRLHGRKCIAVAADSAAKIKNTKPGPLAITVTMTSLCRTHRTQLRWQGRRQR